MNIKEIREKANEELDKEIKNRKEELFRLRFRKVTDVVENPSLVREIRKEIARMKTVLRERRSAELSRSRTLAEKGSGKTVPSRTKENKQDEEKASKIQTWGEPKKETES